jgi:putative heme-binding domain-containing protein
MDGSPLRREHLAASLNDADPQLRRAALWVVSRHPDWSGELIKLLRARAPQSSADEAQAVHEALLSVCENGEAQKAIGELLLLDTMEQCAVKEFPALWTERVRRELRGKDAAVRARVVALVRTRQIPALDDELEQIAASERESGDLRTAALGVLVARRPAMAEPGFRFLLSSLGPETDADLRQTAAQILGRAKLSDTQLLILARDHLSQADPLILPNLLDAFRGARQEEVGKALVSGLLHSPHPADGIAAERIPELLKSFPAAVGAAAQPLLARIAKEKESRDQRLHALEPLLAGGDPDRGREVFFGKKAGCGSCHTIMSDGGDVGPDLTGVGAIRSGLDLLEAVVYPSASFVPGHEVYRVETAREVYTGVQGDSTPDAVLIISGPRDRVRIPRKEIVSMRPSTVSLMPDGFAENLSRRELSDLLAFLQSQKSRTVAAARYE